jgi:hypothetical protein
MTPHPQSAALPTGVHSTPPGQIKSLVAPNCPLTDRDLAEIKAVRSQMVNGVDFH